MKVYAEFENGKYTGCSTIPYETDNPNIEIREVEYEEIAQLEEETFAVAKLRIKREEECFPYINRGTLWYERLTAEQRAELNDWYEAWLDVTETKVIPEKPEWLI